ncbi:NAD-dependent deacylase [bacterium]|nr:NAD-dependent deacylase [bacterium]
MREIARLACRARCIVVSTGAGTSAESGIPTFRDAQTGLWARYDPVMLASYEGFVTDPENVWRWYDERRQAMALASPNPGHLALARWEALALAGGQEFLLATQNIDGLHSRAGSMHLLELHGNIWFARPLKGAYSEACELPQCPLPQLPPYDGQGRLLRPHVVWFGEMLDNAVLSQAMVTAGRADLLLVVGSSSQVYPAAALPHAALRKGGTVVEINPSETELTPHAHFSLRGPSGELLPQLLAEIELLHPAAEAAAPAQRKGAP